MAIDPKRVAEKLYPDMTATLKREAEYFEALGRFVDAFSQMETAMALTFWNFAGVSKEIARSVFSGVRAKEAGEQCRRIMEAVGIKPEEMADFKYLTDQLGLLNTARNDIVHYGATAIGSNDAYVTNVLKAHTEKKATKFPVSPEILRQMQADATKITLHLNYEWLGRDRPKGALGQAALERALQSPWQYKHQPLPVAQKAEKDKKPPASHPK